MELIGYVYIFLKPKQTKLNSKSVFGTITSNIYASV